MQELVYSAKTENVTFNGFFFLFQIMMYYNIADYRNPLEFLTLLAQKKGMLKKGGVPNTEGAAKFVLCDWTG